jgi:hypothetical protein
MVQGIVFSGSQVFPIDIVQFGLVYAQNGYCREREFERKNVIICKPKRFSLNLPVSGSMQASLQHSG